MIKECFTNSSKDATIWKERILKPKYNEFSCKP